MACDEPPKTPGQQHGEGERILAKDPDMPQSVSFASYFFPQSRGFSSFGLGNTISKISLSGDTTTSGGSRWFVGGDMNAVVPRRDLDRIAKGVFLRHRVGFVTASESLRGVLAVIKEYLLDEELSPGISHSASGILSPYDSLSANRMGPLRSYSIGTTFVTAILLCSFITPARALNGDDFANNLFSDLGPILALFGEQVAKQFLSESSGIADSILFAMAPLGIITGIVSAIRVAGHPWLKALVGRGKEGLAQAELELMSSNSQDVGEMWNGEAIIRVLGTPQVFQFVYSPFVRVKQTGQLQPGISDDGVSDSALGIESTGSKTLNPIEKIGILDDKNYFFERSHQKQLDVQSSNERGLWDENYDIEMPLLLPNESSSDTPYGANDGKNPPKISLNARGKLISNLEKWLMAAVAMFAQLAVLIFGGFISYHPSLKRHFLKAGLPPSREAFPSMLAGTVCISIGMFICSYVIDLASTEEAWVLRNDLPDQDSQNCQVAWVQKGGTVNDQAFAPYLIFGDKSQKKIRTSHRCHRGHNQERELRFWVLLGTVVSVAGFIIQFIGLRGMNWAATVAQLAATAFVTAIRSLVRRRMTKEPAVLKAVEGHELDCMARNMSDCLAWKVIPQIPEDVSPEQCDDFAYDTMLIRKQLGHLSGWPTEVSDVADILCPAMEKTLAHIYQSKDIHLREYAEQLRELEWTLPVLALQAEPLSTTPSLHDEQLRRSEPLSASPVRHYRRLIFKFTRPDHRGMWSVCPGTKDEIAAILSLWKLRFAEEEKHHRTGDLLPESQDLGDTRTIAKLLSWPRYESHRELFRLWMGSNDMDIKNESPQDNGTGTLIPIHRFIGSLKAARDLQADCRSFVTFPDAFVKKLFAQEIFSSFFLAAVDCIKKISGAVEALLDESSIQGFRHSELTQLVEIITATGLGSRQEISMKILTHLGEHQLLPRIHEESKVVTAHCSSERILRRSSLFNHWGTIASDIQQLTGGHDGAKVKGMLEKWSIEKMAERFAIRMEAFRKLVGAEGETCRASNHSYSLFLQWLKGLDVDSLKLAPTSFDADGWLLRGDRLDAGMEQKMERFIASFDKWDFGWQWDLQVPILIGIMDSDPEQDLQQVLREAVISGYDSVVEVLIDKGIDTYGSGMKLGSPLMLAVSLGHAAIIQQLLDQLFLHSPNDYRQFQIVHQPIFLWNAARAGDGPTVRVLLPHTLAGLHADFRQTVLILAAGNGPKGIVKELVESGATIDGRLAGSYNQTWLLVGDRGGHVWERWTWDAPTKSANISTAAVAVSMRTALQAAAEGGHFSAVKWLLKKGASVNTEPSGRSWYSALQAAAGGGYLNVVDMLVKSNANINERAWGWSGRTALQAAAAGGHLEVVNQLLSFGADFNEQPASSGGRTALQAAAEGGHFSVVDRLLDGGARVDAPPAAFFGLTAFQSAAAGGNLAVVDRLLSHRAYGQTSFREVATEEHLESERGASPPDVADTNLRVVTQQYDQTVDIDARPAMFSGRTALQAAAEAGHLQIVNRLLERNVNPNARPSSDWGLTALQAAASRGYLKIVNRLLENGADANAQPARRGGRTALQAAAQWGHSNVVDQLLTHGAHVNARPAMSEGRTALQAAAEVGNLEIVNRLLERSAAANAAASKVWGRTALQAAASRGHFEVVNRLLESGADINAVPATHYGRTALQAAAERGHQAVVQRLLESGADVNGSPCVTEGLSALAAAAEGGYLTIVNQLLEHGADMNAKAAKYCGLTVLQAAAKGGHLAVVNRLLANGGDVNEAPGEGAGRTSLQAAAGGGHVAVVQRLLREGAHVNRQPASHDGRTALQAAAELGHLETVSQLLQNGAQVNAAASEFRLTALPTAAQGGHMAIVDLLLEKGAKVNDRTEEAVVALEAAVAHGRLAVVNRLLECGADMDASKRGVLLVAAEGGHLAVVERLLQNNADVNAPPAKHGRTAIQAAAEGGHLAVVERLLENNADFNAPPAKDFGRTTLQAAAGEGHLAVVNWLLENNVDVNALPAENYGKTALQAAAGEGHLVVVGRLLENNANVNTLPAENHGKTALQAAAEEGHLAVVELLLESNADVNALPVKDFGRTALQLAIERKHVKVAERLRAASAA